MLAPSRETGASDQAARAEPDLLPLVRRSQQGDDSAFEELYRACVGMVHGLSLRLCGDPVEAEIRTQDVFVRAWERLGTYDARGSFRGWLRRLAIHVVYDQRRAVRRRRGLVEPFPAHVAEDADPAAALGARVATETPLEAIDLERAVARLPEGARMVFVLHDVEGYKHREIGTLLGVDPGTSKAQLHRARRLLRVMLARERGRES
ncbi:MAG: RNA polymerase sigma factor [Candidatus Krumholzibacteriia bacterium]